MDFHFSLRNNILVDSFRRDLKFLETFGIVTALIPFKKLVTNFGHQYRMHFPLVMISILIAVSQTIFAWDNMDPIDKKKNSEKIEYIVFHAALWISSTVGRIAFILCASNCGKFFADANNYLKNFVVPLSPQISEKPHVPFKNRRKFKLTCLLALHIIYILLMIEFLVKEFATPYGNTKATNCYRSLIPCNYFVVNAILTVAFQFLQSAPQYFLTYFVIVMSDFLIQALESFQHIILHGKPAFGIRGTKGNGNRKNVLKIFPTSDMIFTTPGGNVDIPSTLFTTTKHKIPFEKVSVGPNDLDEDTVEGDLHEQFAHLRDLFTKFIRSIGAPLITSCFTDILILICMIFSLIPQLTRANVPVASSGLESASAHPIGPIISYYPSSTPTSTPELGTPSPDGLEFPNGTSASAGAGGWMSHLSPGVPEGEEEMSYFTKDLLFFFHYSFQILYETRAILLASIGTVMKYKINHLKDMIDLNVRPTSNYQPLSGRPQFERLKVSLSANSNKHTLDPILVNKIEKWKWEFRPMDMVTVDLSLIPTLLGTVMTYVVVLLQIRISEEQATG